MKNALHSITLAFLITTFPNFADASSARCALSEDSPEDEQKIAA